MKGNLWDIIGIEVNNVLHVLCNSSVQLFILTRHTVRFVFYMLCNHIVMKFSFSEIS